MKLPETWVETTVRQVIIDLQTGFAQRPGEESEGTVPQIRTHNISPDGILTTRGIKHVTPSDQELAKYTLTAGDVVFNNTNSEEWVGKTALFDVEGHYVFSNHITRLRANTALVSPAFLATYLHLLWKQGYSKTRAKQWVNQAAVDGASLAKFKIPLPSIPEQQIIIEILTQAELVGLHRVKVSRLASKLARERFFELFGHPAENPLNFETQSFARFGTLDRGISKHRPRDAAHLYGGPYPFIQTGDVANAGDWVTRYSNTYSEAGLKQSKLWPKGTLCITIAANIGRAAILDFDACFPDSIVGFIPAEGIHPEYILYCLRFYQEFFEQRAPKSAQMNINLEVLRRLHIPKPPEHLQRSFANFVKQLRTVESAINSQAKKHDALLSELRLAAFTGELTENWRATHSAELAAAAAIRDTAISTRGSMPIKIPSVIEHPEHAAHPARQWTIAQLSDFQRYVFQALQQWKGMVLPDDLEGFEDFYANTDTPWLAKQAGLSADHVRRALEQLARLGLITKVTVPTVNNEYAIAYRPLREGENSRLNDVDRLTTLLKMEETTQ